MYHNAFTIHYQFTLLAYQGCTLTHKFDKCSEHPPRSIKVAQGLCDSTHDLTGGLTVVSEPRESQ